MAIPQKRIIDAEGRKQYTNAAPSTAAGEVVVHEQLTAAIEGLAWKDAVRVASTVNLTLAAPGASIDAVALAASDRVLVKNQSTQTENGIYIWNGAAVFCTAGALLGAGHLTGRPIAQFRHPPNTASSNTVTALLSCIEKPLGPIWPYEDPTVCEPAKPARMAVYRFTTEL